MKLGVAGSSNIQTNNVTSSTKHYDIITAARKLVEESPLEWTTRDMDEWARMNINVDLEAEYYWEKSQEAGYIPQQTMWREP